MPHLAALTPDAILLLLTGGILLVYLELNRPGLILPGAAGLTLILLSVAHLLPAPPKPAAACLLGYALLALSSRTRSRLLLAAVATAALLYGFLGLAPDARRARTHAYVAVACALFLGVGTSLLTTIAARARQNKGLDLK